MEKSLLQIKYPIQNNPVALKCCNLIYYFWACLWHTERPRIEFRRMRHFAREF